MRTRDVRKRLTNQNESLPELRTTTKILAQLRASVVGIAVQNRCLGEKKRVPTKDKSSRIRLVSIVHTNTTYT